MRGYSGWQVQRGLFVLGWSTLRSETKGKSQIMLFETIFDKEYFKNLIFFNAWNFYTESSFKVEKE